MVNKDSIGEGIFGKKEIDQDKVKDTEPAINAHIWGKR